MTPPSRRGQLRPLASLSGAGRMAGAGGRRTPACGLRKGTEDGHTRWGPSPGKAPGCWALCAAERPTSGLGEATPPALVMGRSGDACVQVIFKRLDVWGWSRLTTAVITPARSGVPAGAEPLPPTALHSKGADPRAWRRPQSLGTRGGSSPPLRAPSSLPVTQERVHEPLDGHREPSV